MLIGKADLEASDLLDQAIEFAAAMDAYARLARTPNWTVMHFLIGRSMELALKSFALHHGADEKQLRQLGHDLAAALTHAEAIGFAHATPFTDKDRDMVRSLNLFYRTKLLEYPQRTSHLRYGTQFMRVLLDRMIETVYKAVRGDAVYEHDRDVRGTPGLRIDELIDYRE